MIVGAGIIGLTAAIELQKAGCEVTIIDKDFLRKNASFGNAGHIATEQIEPLASWASVKSFFSRWFLLGGALSLPPFSIAQWLPFSLRLIAKSNKSVFEHGKQTISNLMKNALVEWQSILQTIGRPDLLSNNGHYIVWESEKSAIRSLKSWRAKNLGNTSFESLNSSELARIENIVKTKLYGGIKFLGTGHIKDNLALLKASYNYLKQNGAQIINEKVVRISENQIYLENGSILNANKILISTGFWSKSLLEDLGHKVPIIAERGYHIEAQWGDGTGNWNNKMAPIVFEDRSMIVTSFDETLRAASFVEFSNPNAKPDIRKWQRIRQNSSQIGINFDENAEEWIGCRPTLPDYIPAIGASNRAEGIYYAFGHQHLGLTLAAVTAKIVKEMICDDILPSQSLSLDRFGGV